MYVKLFGGPFDGRQESVLDGCDALRLRQTLEDSGTEILHIYRRSKADPERFVYEGDDHVD